MKIQDREQFQNDLIRLGVFSQLEGNFIEEKNRNNYRFRFNTNQIDDMKELISRITGKDFESSLIISVSSKDLYDQIYDLGFKRFKTHDWNVPDIKKFTTSGKKEYIRAVIDSLGNVDIDDMVPVVKISSVNGGSLSTLSKLFGGVVNGPYDKRFFLSWKGSNAIDLLDFLDWRFNNGRNARGAQLIRVVKWGDYFI